MSKKTWVKWVMGLTEKKQVLQLAIILKISRYEAAGRCMSLWEWAEDQTEDGNVSGVTYNTIDELQGLSGFAQAMEDVGWLEQKEGGIHLIQFDVHNGQLAKSRAVTARRVSKHRNALEVTNSLPDKTRQYKTKDKKNKPKTSEVCARVLNDSSLLKHNAQFREAWASWLNHRKEIKKPITPTSAERQLARCEKIGADRAITMIEYTIEKGWQGLREPDNHGANKSQLSIEELAKASALGDGTLL